MAETKSILIADDHESIREIVRAVLESAGFRVLEAVDGIDAVDKASEAKPDLIILDLRMPNLNGVEAASLIKGRLPNTPIILFTMYEAGPAVLSAAGIASVIRKPEGVVKLAQCVQTLLAPEPESLGTPSPDSPGPAASA
jgi:CheY-like chemotaxis protein